jgi:hypothetical protein
MDSVPKTVTKKRAGSNLKKQLNLKGCVLVPEDTVLSHPLQVQF